MHGFFPRADCDPQQKEPWRWREAGQSGLCNLYLGVYGQSKGRHGPAWGIGKFFPVADGQHWVGGSGPLVAVRVTEF